jgi:hypothetical protein
MYILRLTEIFNTDNMKVVLNQACAFEVNTGVDISNGTVPETFLKIILQSKYNLYGGIKISKRGDFQCSKYSYRKHGQNFTRIRIHSNPAFKLKVPYSITKYCVNRHLRYVNVLGGRPRYTHCGLPCSAASLPRFAKARGIGKHLSAELGKRSEIQPQQFYIESPHVRSTVSFFCATLQV